MTKLLLAIALSLTFLPAVAESPQNAKSREPSAEAPPNQPVNEFSDWEINVSGKAFYDWRLRGDGFEQKLRDEIELRTKDRADVPNGLRCIVGYTIVGTDLVTFSLIRSSDNAKFDQLVLGMLREKQLEDEDTVRRRHPTRFTSRPVELRSGKISKRDSDFWWPWQRKIIETLDYNVRLAMPSGTQSVPSQRCIASFMVTSEGTVEFIGTAYLVKNPKFLSIVEEQIHLLQGSKLLKFPDGASDKFRLISTEVYYRPLHPYKEQTMHPIGDFGN